MPKRTYKIPTPTLKPRVFETDETASRGFPDSVTPINRFLSPSTTVLWYMPCGRASRAHKFHGQPAQLDARASTRLEVRP